MRPSCASAASTSFGSPLAGRCSSRGPHYDFPARMRLPTPTPRRTAIHTPHPHTRALRLHSLHSIPLLKLGSSARGWASEPHLWLRASFDGRHIVRPRKGHAMPISIRCFVRCEPPSRRAATPAPKTPTRTRVTATRMMTEHTQLSFSRRRSARAVQKDIVPRGHALYHLMPVLTHSRTHTHHTHTPATFDNVCRMHATLLLTTCSLFYPWFTFRNARLRSGLAG